MITWTVEDPGQTAILSCSILYRHERFLLLLMRYGNSNILVRKQHGLREPEYVVIDPLLYACLEYDQLAC